MVVFTLCDCDNITYSYLPHYKQKLNRSRNQKNRTVWMSPEDISSYFVSIYLEVNEIKLLAKHQGPKTKTLYIYHFKKGTFTKYKKMYFHFFPTE